MQDSFMKSSLSIYCGKSGKRTTNHRSKAKFQIKLVRFKSRRKLGLKVSLCIDFVEFTLYSPFGRPLRTLFYYNFTIVRHFLPGYKSIHPFDKTFTLQLESCRYFIERQHQIIARHINQ